LTSHIALDAVSGDHGLSEIIPAAILTLNKHPDLKLTLVGDENLIRSALRENNYSENNKLHVKHASEVVEMYEQPAMALRNKKDSSMRVTINLVKNGEADACVSAGNTGALMATARFVLKMLPGIGRPAICTVMPGINGYTRILDLGANLNPSSKELFQYAVMGAEITRAVEDIDEPRVALLNVGSEEIKGNNRVKQAANLLANSHLDYVGFVEGNDIYSGKVDVIVCDGFSGNIALKASEGVAELLIFHAKNEFQKTLYGKLVAMVSLPVLKSIRSQIDPRKYNGASLLGLRGIVVKSHGSADKISFAHAIEEAMMEIEKKVPERIISRLEEVLINKELN